MRVPGRAAGLTLGEHGPCHFNEHEDAAEDDGGGRRQRNDDLRDPPDLGDRDSGGIREADTAPRRVIFGGAQPLKHQCHAHDHVAEHHDGIVEVPAALDGGEHAWHAGREYQHANHLHHGDEPEHPVVRVVGRGKPREIDPGPADGKARKAKAHEGRDEVALCEHRSGLGRGKTEARRERQIEQEFKRRRDTVLLVRVASGHVPRGAPDDADAGAWVSRALD